MYVASVYYNLNNNDDNESSAAPLHMCSRWVLVVQYADRDHKVESALSVIF